jgi:hypothetical protein
MEAVQRIFTREIFVDHYYERKMKDLFELKKGSMVMDEYENRFFELLKYVGFIRMRSSKSKGF